MATTTRRLKPTSVLALTTLVLAVAAGSSLSGCRNWCHTANGVQPKAGASGSCTTPADHANAAHKS
ncbi:MAG: hypothetical protein IOD12_11790 [Silvanigrellales bacterium]|jgi:hypothetical protein|nr:hypothetical protein [Silvanigrellales bacterium]